MAVLERIDWPTRQRGKVAYDVTIGLIALIIFLTQIGPLLEAASHPHMWLMASLATLSGVLAFIDRPPPGRAPMVVCPTICFTFAILLCWGLGPAIAAQVAGDRLRGVANAPTGAPDG